MSLAPSVLESRLRIEERGSDAFFQFQTLDEVIERVVPLKSLHPLLLEWRALRMDVAQSGESLFRYGASLTQHGPGSDSMDSLVRWIARNGGQHALRMVIEIESMRLSELPWESLVGPSPGGNGEGFLALIPGLQVVRRYGEPLFSPAPRRLHALRTLVVAANPGSPRFPSLPWQVAELRALQSAIDAAGLGVGEVSFLTDATPASFEAALVAQEPHLVFLSGHGTSEVRSGGYVMHGSGPGKDVVLDRAQFVELLAATGVQFAVLSICDSAGRPLGLAEGLAERGIGSIAMQTPVADAQVPQFVRTLLGSMLDGAPVAEALSEARQSMAPSPGWITPIQVGPYPNQTLVLGRRNVKNQLDDSLPRFEIGMVGRDEWLAQLLDRLEVGGTTVVCGPLGVGKTRLAIEAARQFRAETRFEVDLVDAGKFDSELELRQEVLRLWSQPNDRSWTELFKATDGRVLIIDGLDDEECEATLASLREAGAGNEVRLLVTTRSASGMDLPDEVLLPQFSEDEQFGKELFLEATMSQGLAGIRAEEESDVVAICRELDGLPMAILLAVSRLSVLSLSELSDLVRVRPLGTLGGRRSRFGQQIQRTLSLFDPLDQSILESMALFHGAFDRSDLAALLPDHTFELIDVLDQAVRATVIRRVPEGYRLAPTVRELLLDSSRSSRSFPTLQLRHADRFLHRLAAVERSDTSAENLEEMLADLEAAALHLERVGRLFDARSIVDRIARHVFELGQYQRLRVLAEIGHRVAGSLGDTETRARLMGLEGAAAARLGDYVTCLKIWEEREAYSLKHGHLLMCLDARVDLASQYGVLDQLDTAKKWVTKADALAGKFEDPGWKGQVCAYACQIARKEGDFATSITLANQAIDHILKSSNRSFHDGVILTLARQLVFSGEFGKATLIFFDAFKLLSFDQRKMQLAVCMPEVSNLFERSGQIEMAAKALYFARDLLAEFKRWNRHANLCECIEALWQRHSNHPSRYVLTQPESHADRFDEITAALSLLPSLDRSADNL